MTTSNAIRRVVTGLDAQGRSCVMFDSRIALAETPSATSVGQMWVTDQGDVRQDSRDDMALRPLSLQPPAKGSQLWIVSIPPRHADADAASASQTAHTLHATDTVDYLIMLDGRIRLFLEADETVLRKGDVLVQRGTIHSWENSGSVDAVLAVVLIDASWKAGAA